MITFFIFLLLNAEILALKKPSSISKYRIVGELFYENENLIKSISVLILTLFIYFSFLLSNMLIRKSVIFKSQNGFLYQDEKLIVDDQVKSFFFMLTVFKVNSIPLFLTLPKLSKMLPKPVIVGNWRLNNTSLVLVK